MYFQTIFLAFNLKPKLPEEWVVIALRLGWENTSLHRQRCEKACSPFLIYRWGESFHSARQKRKP
jgi:hypothetical protein